MSNSMPCRKCHGTGGVLTDCLACIGTGWEDKWTRFDCENCGSLVREPDARISPDEDGNRIVCRKCLINLEKASGRPWP